MHIYIYTQIFIYVYMINFKIIAGKNWEKYWKVTCLPHNIYDQYLSKFPDTIYFFRDVIIFNINLVCYSGQTPFAA